VLALNVKIITIDIILKDVISNRKFYLISNSVLKYINQNIFPNN